MLNHADHESCFTLPDGFDDERKELLIANYPDVLAGDSIKSCKLRPHEARVYRI